MTTQSRYSWVRSILALSAVLFFSAAVFAQINGPRPSVTSLGGQFTIFNPPGPRASVTSLGPNGWGGGPCCVARRPRPGFTLQPRHHRGDGFRDGGTYGGYPVYLMPYYYPADVVDPVDDSMEQSYAPGPTIFDRRSSETSNPSAAYNQQLDDRLDRLERQLDEAEQAKPSTQAAQPAIPARDQPDT